jgi:hypothetical protein
MTKFIYFTEEQKKRARETDLVSFLSSRGERLKRSGSEYEWARRHITIRNNKWFDQYSLEGGTAIDFVRREYGLSFPEAMEMLLRENGEARIAEDSGTGFEAGRSKETSEGKGKISLPEASINMRRTYAYLTKTRGIDSGVVSYFADKGCIYEDAKYHNAVFVGADENGIPRHAHKKSTSMRGGTYRGNERGSASDYSFHHIGQSHEIYVFEAPIDMLSYITLHQVNWREHSYVALCSVSDRALLHQLEQNRHIERIMLCLDGDEAGKAATRRISERLKERGYIDVSILSPIYKDWNEDLLFTKDMARFMAACSEDKEAARELPQPEGEKQWEISQC